VAEVLADATSGGATCGVTCAPTCGARPTGSAAGTFDAAADDVRSAACVPASPPRAIASPIAAQAIRTPAA
jgi:hypothetical protein